MELLAVAAFAVLCVIMVRLGAIRDELRLHNRILCKRYGYVISDERAATQQRSSSASA